MCELANISRASFYRHWELTAPPEAEMELRDAIQKASLANHFYGYRRVAQGERVSLIRAVGDFDQSISRLCHL